MTDPPELAAYTSGVLRARAAYADHPTNREDNPMTDPTPREAERQARREALENLAAGYADTTEWEQKKAARKAAAYRPEYDAEADRLRTSIGDALPASVLLALGYHESAREAAQQINDQED